MTITLIRHAKVLANESQKMYASEVPKWVEHYNQAAVDKTLPNDAVVEQIKRANLLLASSLSRTYASLALLGVEPSETDAMFDEAEVPLGKIPYIRLYPRQWLVVLRLMMLMGIGKGSSSLKASKSRSSKAATHLMASAQREEHVALMGHGGMNWMIGKVLEKEGWVCVEDAQSSKNWGYKIYENNTL